MSEEADDAVDDAMAGIFDDENTTDYSRRSGACCRYCKRDGFHWRRTEQGWRLFNHWGEMHLCRSKGGEPKGE